ncbi:hypothetical protein C8A03DRAFT_30785 [Achaetomium macrosporum]|uniref:Uncharacterized protein n=1 Tax=Achaetomium macrosporum TaxID=79813 RepID=A0AAN7HES9_9PEZI|nr:hypothetical protein C8A03DRAFT_30785 [Achaetomium macrosporum]
MARTKNPPRPYHRLPVTNPAPRAKDSLPTPPQSPGPMTSDLGSDSKMDTESDPRPPAGWSSPFELPLPDDPTYGVEAWAKRKKEMAWDDGDDEESSPTWKQCVKQHLQMWKERVEQGLLDYPSDESELSQEAQANLIDRWIEVLRGLKRTPPQWQKLWLKSYGTRALRLCTESQLAALLGVPIDRLPPHNNFGPLVAATLLDPLTELEDYRARSYHKRRLERCENWELFHKRPHPKKRKWQRQDGRERRQRLARLKEIQLRRQEEQRVRSLEREHLECETRERLEHEERLDQQEMRDVEVLEQRDTCESSQTK